MWAGMFLALAGPLSLAQNRRNDKRDVPRPNVQQPGQDNRQPRNEPRRDSRPAYREPSRPSQDKRVPVRPPQFQPAPQPQREYRPYEPPAQGHHSGQWLNQQRARPLDQQKRALENDPSFRRLPRETQREYEQRLQRFNSLPADRQQQVLRRMETWEHLTPQQKQDFRGIGSQFNTLPADRRRAVRNAIDTLRAMPPAARERELQSGRFSQFSPEERNILNGAARLPLAPAPQPESSGRSPSEQQSGNQNNRPQHYVPRPPR